MKVPVETYRGVAYPWQCDSMGHLNTQFYVAMYDTATLHFLEMLADAPQERKRKGLGWADIRQIIEYKHELRAGELVVVTSGLTRIGTKSVHFTHWMRNAIGDELHSTMESITARFDLGKRRAVPLSPALKANAARYAVQSDGAAGG